MNGSTTTREPRHGPGRGAAVGVPVAPSGLPARRRWGRVAAGGVLALVGAWTAASLYASAGERVEVVVAAADVGRFEELGRDDLKVVRVAADPGVDTIPGGDLDELVGRVAATDLSDGVLLSEDQLVDSDERQVGGDEAVVGARLGPGAAPRSALVGGTRVLVVVRPAQTAADGEPVEVEGWLADVGEPDATTGEREASLVVPAGSAAEVAAAAADERIAVVALEGVGGGG
jgi:SAF domain